MLEKLKEKLYANDKFLMKKILAWSLLINFIYSFSVSWLYVAISLLIPIILIMIGTGVISVKTKVKTYAEAKECVLPERDDEIDLEDYFEIDLDFKTVEFKDVALNEKDKKRLLKLVNEKIILEQGNELFIENE
ncbi:hypothetical protein C408_1391 [Vibrio diabolicus E0666]|uniref:hypothetical protein n=1 Tax=Vibrio diabolicus TaxID=50719 RepID=UPI0002B6F910|nr:hypothetical protein [Vibrio diabolicus]EMD80175.1 hypothetical protein C408_1391 [Vibrio diabolicus E0666]